MFLGEGGEGQQIGRGVGEQIGGGREPLGELLDGGGVLGPRLGGIRLGEHGAHERRHQGLRALRHPGQEVAHEVVLMPTSA